MNKHQLGIGLKRPNWKSQYGRLALAVLSVVCLIDSPVRTTENKVDLSGLLESIPDENTHQAADDFTWDHLVASPDLNYTACFGRFQCAKLELPMDYWNASVKDKISLAVIRRPAKVNVTSPRYGGAIQINPGGPGDSGIDQVYKYGDRIGNIVNTQDDQTGMYFDILSFDPRGVGLSTPEGLCPSANWDADTANMSLDKLWSWSEEIGQNCSLPPPNGHVDIKRYMTTRCVAQDMISLLEAHGRWRQQEGERLTAMNEQQRHNTADSVSWKYRSGQEKLQYWGFSYGSHLGMTFAALFPGRVERMVVDGVIDAEDYTKGLENHFVDDSRKAMAMFYSDCARAGYPRCRFASDESSGTAEDLKVRVQSIMAGLKRHSVQIDVDGYCTKLNEVDAESLIFVHLHREHGGFEAIANLLYDAETALAMIKQDGGQTARDVVWDEVDTSVEVDQALFMAIACTDADDQSKVSKQDLAKHVEKLRKQSPSFGPLLRLNLVLCPHYHIRSEHRFTGPWTGNTSHPILLLGNIADPITPLRNAVKMAKGFDGAIVLTQNYAGHTSMSTQSNCTERHVRKYFQSGDLPPNSTVCDANEKPFNDVSIDWQGLSCGQRPSRR